MKYSLRSLMIVALIGPPVLALVSCCGGTVTDFIVEPLPFPDGAPPGFYFWKELYVNAARLMCPVAALAMMVAVLLLRRLRAKIQGMNDELWCEEQARMGMAVPNSLAPTPNPSKP